MVVRNPGVAPSESVVRSPGSFIGVAEYFQTHDHALVADVAVSISNQRFDLASRLIAEGARFSIRAGWDSYRLVDDTIDRSRRCIRCRS